MLFDGCRHKQGLTPWRLLCLLMFAIVSTGQCRSVDVGGDVDLVSTSGPTPRKTLNQEIGSPSELAWQAWLHLESNPGGPAALDSANLLRRITPKSIFIAPELVSCPNGYSSDGKGVCKPDPISIDEEAQRQFFLKRLNAMYGKGGGGRKKPVEQPGGPLQFNIPISLPAKGNPAELQSPQKQPVPPPKEQVVGTEDQSTLTPQTVAKDVKKTSTDVIAEVIYEVVNATKKVIEEVKEEASSIFGNTSVPKKDLDHNSPPVPVAEIVDVMNKTISGVVDYKIPVSPKGVQNHSDTPVQSQKIDTRHPSEKKLDDSLEDSSPAVVLLLSATKLPSITTTTPKEIELPKIDASSQSSKLDEQESDVNENTTTIPVDNEPKQYATNSDGDGMRPTQESTIQTVVPLIPQTSDIVQSNTEQAYTPNVPEDETEYPEEEEEDEEGGAEEEEAEPTQMEPEPVDHEDYDDTTEDELLKAGEAGMMISSKNQDLIRTKNPKEQETTQTDVADVTTMSFPETTIVTTTPIIYLQDAFDAAGDTTLKDDPTSYTREDIASTQTTEAPSTIVTTTVSGVKEITLYSKTPPRVESSSKASTTRVNPTQGPTTTFVGDQDVGTDPKPFFESEKELVTRPEVVFSTRESRPMLTTFGLKKPTHRPKVVKNPYSWGSNEDESDVPPVLRTTPSPFRRNQKPWFSSSTSDDIIFKSDDDIPSEFKDQMSDNSKSISVDHKRLPSYGNNDESSTYIRFPENSPENRLNHGHVRFPSDDVNSIHNQDTYKDHLLSPYRSREDFHGNSATSTKSSVPGRQKAPSAQWRVPPPGIRTDRQHQQQIQSSNTDALNNQRQQKQKPMLLRFWARMPLVRDLTFYPTTSHGSHNEPIGGHKDDSTNARQTDLSSRFGPLSSSNPSNRRPNYYKEMSSYDVNRLLAQHMGQPSIGG